MVLQANGSKRADNQNQNLVPDKIEPIASRSFRTSFHTAASRRRARANGSKSTKYAIEQAKKRSVVNTPANVIRMAFPSTPRTPSPVADVEMQDAPPPAQDPSAPSQPSTIPVTFPLCLPRPEYADVPKTCIEVIDPTLAKTNVQYIRDVLMASSLGPKMYVGLRNFTAKDKDLLSKGTLPREITMMVEDLTSVLPTHMMAIHGPPPKNSKDVKTKVTLLPVHSIILAANCAKLPPFPPGAATDPDPNAREIDLPVHALLLHSPNTFPMLLEYLYLKRTDVLLRNLIQSSFPPKLVEQPEHHEAFAKALGKRFSVQGLLYHMTVVRGLWQNVCALGVFDDELWASLDFAWKILLMGLAFCTGKPETMESLKAAVAALETEQPGNSPEGEDQAPAPSTSTTSA